MQYFKYNLICAGALFLAMFWVFWIGGCPMFTRSVDTGFAWWFIFIFTGAGFAAGFPLGESFEAHIRKHKREQ